MRKKANKGSILLASLLVVSLVFSGCQKKEQPPPPPQPNPAVKAAKPPVQTQASTAKPSARPEQTLDFATKKDPFRPFVAEPAAQPKAKRTEAVKRTGELLPIQSYDVNKFVVSGIVVGLKENTALIVDPAGRGYVVREGMLIGNSDGRITRITASSVEVVEPYRDDNGRSRKRTIKLTLLKKM